MLKAIKIRLYPNQEEIKYINNLLGTSRFVYNQLLSFKIYEYNQNNVSVTFSELGKKLTSLKAEYEWIKNSHSKVLQQSVINLDIAYKNFFKRNDVGFPKFKSKHNNKQTARFPVDAISGVKGNRINIIRPLKNIHYKCSKRDEKYLNKNQDHIKSATLTRTKSGRYYFSILIDKPEDKKLPKNDDILGIDLGIKDFIITSNNERFENIKIKGNNKNKIVKLHRELSRKKKGSSNKNKSRVKLARYYEKLNNIKENYLHQVTNQLLDENQVIIIENLSVGNMIKNHKLARSLQELSLYRFKEMLKYKANWYGRDIIEIDRWFPSSKLCSVCGHKNTNLKLKDRSWVCPVCGEDHDRDYNAAKNIKKEGQRILSINDNIRPKNKIGLSSPKLTPLESSPLGSR